MSKERPIVEDGGAPGGTTHMERTPGPTSEPATSDVDVTRALCARVVELERELEQRERQHQRVIARYEKLLAEARDESDNSGSLIAWLRSLR